MMKPALFFHCILKCYPFAPLQSKGIPQEFSLFEKAHYLPEGRRMVKRLPSLNALSTSMEPLWASTSLRAMVSPKPLPPVLRDREGSVR